MPARVFHAGDHREDPGSVECRETQLRRASDQFGLYVSGNKVTDQPQILFQRLDVKEVMEKVEVIQAKQKAAMAAAKEEEEKAEEAVVDVEPKEDYVRRLWKNAVPGR